MDIPTKFLLPQENVYREGDINEKQRDIIPINTKRGCVKTLAQPFLMIYSPAIFPFVYAAFFSFIW